MNPEAQARLDEILKLSPETLNEDQIMFLRARSGYLKKAQLEEYAEVLKVKEEKEVAPKQPSKGKAK